MFGSREGSLNSVVTYTVHEAAGPQGDRLDRADELQFVKDGFSWLTALLPPLGYAANSLWLPALAYLVFVSVIVWALAKLGISETQLSLFVIALNIYLAFELSTLKRWSLDTNGWTTLGTVSGRNLAECERRFLESWLPAQPIIQSNKPAAHAGPDQRRSLGWPFGAKV